MCTRTPRASRRLRNQLASHFIWAARDRFSLRIARWGMILGEIAMNAIHFNGAIAYRGRTRGFGAPSASSASVKRPPRARTAAPSYLIAGTNEWWNAMAIRMFAIRADSIGARILRVASIRLVDRRAAFS